MIWLGYLFVLVTSSLNAVQTGCNARLQKGLGQPVLAAAVVYCVGLVLLLSILAIGLSVRGRGWLPLEPMTRVPWWALVGGTLGASYIVAMMVMTERVGSAAFLAISFVATLTTSVLLDHFGWLGLKHHPAGLWRIVGCGLMTAGVALVAKF